MGYAPDYISAVKKHNRIARLPVVDSRHVAGERLTVLSTRGKVVGVAYDPRTAREIALRHSRGHSGQGDYEYYSILELPGCSLFWLTTIGW